MRKRLTAVFIMAVFALSALAGCGAKKEEVTAASLIKAVDEKTKANKSADAHMNMNISMEGEDVSSLGLGDSLTISMDADMQTVNDPVAVYMDGTMSMFGMSFDMEMYTVTEDSKIVTYVGMMNQWMKQEAEVDMSQMSQLTAASEDLMANLDSLALSDETEEADGKEVYIIKGTLEGEDIKGIIGPAQSVFSAVGGSDALDDSTTFDGIAVDFTYAVGKEDQLPVYVDYVFKGFENITAAEDLDMNISNFTMHIDYKGFDTVDSIEVPQEVRDQAQDMSNQ